jgi:hypothetical protein
MQETGEEAVTIDNFEARACDVEAVLLSDEYHASGTAFPAAAPASICAIIYAFLLQFISLMSPD